MPQTISIQRGSTTVTSSAVGTLFTNSSVGLGTRVIINQLFFLGTNNAAGNRTSGGTLIINGSGVGQSPIGTVGSGTTPSAALGPFLSANIPFGVNGQNGVSYNGSPALTLGQAQPGIAASTGATNVNSVMPQTFWIGPSDAIQVSPYGFITQSGKSTSLSVVTIRYSFTLITES